MACSGTAKKISIPSTPSFEGEVKPDAACRKIFFGLYKISFSFFLFLFPANVPGQK
jgi:hypothetical protein